MIRFLLLLSAAFAPAMPVAAQELYYKPSVTVTRTEETLAPVVPAPVVLELFTSQGCAYCPPADALLGKLIQQPGIIGLACHVDYFRVTKNSLGQPFCTRRQNNYGRMLGNRPRYTPQLVVNGQKDLIGYEASKVSAAIMKARAKKAANIPLTPDARGWYSAAMPLMDLQGAPVRVWMAVYDAPHRQAMTEGNNLGKMVTYYNVVRRIDDLGPWDGSAALRSFDPQFGSDSGGFALVGQFEVTGEIVAAGNVQR